MGSFVFGHADTRDLRGGERYPHLKVRPEGPGDEARLAALEKMGGGEDIWLDVRSVMLYLQLGRTRVYEMIRGSESTDTNARAPPGCRPMNACAM